MLPLDAKRLGLRETLDPPGCGEKPMPNNCGRVLRPPVSTGPGSTAAFSLPLVVF